MEDQKRVHSLKHLTTGKFGSVDTPRNEKVEELFAPHVQSFNYLVRHGLEQAVKNIDPIEMALPNGDRIAIEIKDLQLERPSIPGGDRIARTVQMYPAESRQRGTTYSGNLKVNLILYVNGLLVDGTTVVAGKVPVMVKSLACNLAECSRADLVKLGEEGDENGGYFIINGNEKILRLLVAQRRNYPLCLKRMNWVKRVANCTKYGLSVRCVSADQHATTMVLHYLKTGSAVLSIAYHKELFFIPVMLIMRALVYYPDKNIYDLITQGKRDDTFLESNIVAMMREVMAMGVLSQNQALAYLGNRFRIKLDRPEWYTDIQIGQYLIRKCIATHLSDFKEKFHFLIHMVLKLYAFINDECVEESVDNPQFHEVLLSGHLYLCVIKEKLESWLWGMKDVIKKNIKNPKAELRNNLQSLTRNFVGMLDIGRSMEYFLATGNLVSRDMLGLQQVNGFAVVTDRLNHARFISHFRCIHRGAHFTSMRNSAVRYLKPEYWGFVCPVHTPDGPPCGLMNHLAAHCSVVTHWFQGQPMLRGMLVGMGVVSVSEATAGFADDAQVVILDGAIVGHASIPVLQQIAQQLRHFKVMGHPNVPSDMEIVIIEPPDVGGLFPGLYLFTEMGRFLRPVKNLHYKKEERIGIFEQVSMGIAQPEDDLTGKAYVELGSQEALSALAGMTPFSNHNQAPRNIYQCQMMKQTMGTPVHAFPKRADNKMYRLNTPQVPLLRTQSYDQYNMDDYPLGTNAIVAVITHSGYDMEDALIINKASLERGLFRGTVYKSEYINLRGKDKGPLPLVLACSPEDPAVQEGFLSTDGLPPVGRLMKKGEPFYCIHNLQTKEYKVHLYSKEDEAYIDQIKALGNDSGNCLLEKVCIILRTVRIPVVGDKFASRHGQKGTVSMVWPQEDMPFTESGLVPDVLFNAHSYPSRMTIGMLIESKAGKLACTQGHSYDATPFTTTEENSNIKIYGQYLKEAGYNHYGCETMYCGAKGVCMRAAIFIGNIYYQRLRHMVNDKFQVRTVGLMDNLTQQPVKGRKRGGGVRFGEMERDAIVSSGGSSALMDRLAGCSDLTTMLVCVKCGGADTIKPSRATDEMELPQVEERSQQVCIKCRRQGSLRTVRMPYVMKYLLAELVSMNVDLWVVLGSFLR